MVKSSPTPRAISFITYAGEPSISIDDIPLAQELEKRGVAAYPCPWDLPADSSIETNAYLMRSAWNYDRAPDTFLLWLKDLEKNGKTLINSQRLIRWNISKRYLLEVERYRLEIPKTRIFIPRDVDPRSLISDFAGSETVVVKPCISLSANNTFLVRKAELHHTIATLLNPEREYLIQEFLPEITSGELSFVFFDGRYSHCIIKKPKQGDFRVQADHGASRAKYQPAARQIEDALGFLKTAPEVPTYARVDVVLREERMILMEIELIDPVLFLKWEPESAVRFADAITRLCA
jgi:glutathione synthase/RimK-type ligase-like ATP-grasp enzyme